MRLKVQEPVQSLFRTEALSPTWTIGCKAFYFLIKNLLFGVRFHVFFPAGENEYPDSPESNETIIAKPYRVFSPTRDVAINTGERFVQIGNRAVQINPIEKPMRENYQPNLLTSYPYGEIPYQNTVQNVQNQIIQENMQQYQNIQQQHCGIGWNQLPQRNVPANNQFGCQHNVNQQSLPNGITHSKVMQNFNVENTGRQQNQLQQGALYADNRAMPQEPCKVAYRQNLATAYRQYQDARLACTTNVKQNGSLSPDYSPDVSQNLNDGFCLSKSDEKTHNLNETYNRPANLDNPNVVDATVMTNNATCNDDSMLLEFLLDSPIPSENGIGGKSRDSAVNTDEMPSAPFRKKKAQKLEQLVLNAINSQNEVVNKVI